MKKFNTLLTYVSSNRIWLITLGCLDLFFAFLAWVAYPGDFLSLVGLMIFVSLAAFVIPFVISIHKRSKIDAAFTAYDNTGDRFGTCRPSSETRRAASRSARSPAAVLGDGAAAPRR